MEEGSVRGLLVAVFQCLYLTKTILCGSLLFIDCVKVADCQRFEGVF